MKNIKAPTLQYPKFPANTQIFARPSGFSDQQLYCCDYYHGATSNAPTAYTFLNKPYIDGISVVIRWNRVETAQGVYNWTYLDALVNDAKLVYGKKIAFYLFFIAYAKVPSNQRPVGNDGGLYHSFVPEYIMDDHVTYGGVAGYGGECETSLFPGEYLSVRWHNPNVMARYNEFMIALANRYKNQIEYIYLDEFWTAVSNAARAEIPGGDVATKAAYIVQAKKDWYQYAWDAFQGGTAKVFCKANYLSATPYNNDAYDPLFQNWCGSTGKYFANESTPDMPLNFKYPFNLGATTNTSGIITTLENIAKSYSNRTHLCNTDTWGATFGSLTQINASQAINTYRFYAKTLEGASSGIIDILIPDGVTRPEQPQNGMWWRLIAPILESRYLR